MIKMLSNLGRKGTFLNVLNYLPIFYSKNVFTVESFLIQSVTSKDINYHHIYFLFYWRHQQIIVYKLNRQKKKKKDTWLVKGKNKSKLSLSCIMEFFS